MKVGVALNMLHLLRDAAFAGPPASAGTAGPAVPGASGILAPA